jgi:hypothetical protein
MRVCHDGVRTSVFSKFFKVPNLVSRTDHALRSRYRTLTLAKKAFFTLEAPEPLCCLLPHLACRCGAARELPTALQPLRRGTRTAKTPDT